MGKTNGCSTKETGPDTTENLCMLSTPFAHEIINEFVGHEFYSFWNGFSWYNQVSIAK